MAGGADVGRGTVGSEAGGVHKCRGMWVRARLMHNRACGPRAAGQELSGLAQTSTPTDQKAHLHTRAPHTRTHTPIRTGAHLFGDVKRIACAISPARTSAARTSSGAIGSPAASPLVQPSGRCGISGDDKLKTAPLAQSQPEAAGLSTLGSRQYQASYRVQVPSSTVSTWRSPVHLCSVCGGGGRRFLEGQKRAWGGEAAACAPGLAVLPIGHKGGQRWHRPRARAAHTR